MEISISALLYWLVCGDCVIQDSVLKKKQIRKSAVIPAGHLHIRIGDLLAKFPIYIPAMQFAYAEVRIDIFILLLHKLKVNDLVCRGAAYMQCSFTSTGV